MESGYRGRFAPSPTGRIHAGTAASALMAWCRARQVGGAFIVRLEDLDAPRVVPGAAAAMLEDLRWLGIDWDEGPDVGGPRGPYTQSERGALYDEVHRVLVESGRAYPCSCSRKEIAAEVAAMASAPHGPDGVLYPGTCRPDGPHRGPRHPSRPTATRFLMPEPPPSFVDARCGPSPAGLGAGDFVVLRRDGQVAYQLACVVDDHAMGVTEVVRGDDLLASTPRQIAIYKALGWEPPAFLHTPLLVAGDGERLAKRHGAVALAELREAGVSPPVLVGRLARALGLRASDAPLSAAELLDDADVAGIPRGAVRWSS